MRKVVTRAVLAAILVGTPTAWGAGPDKSIKVVVSNAYDRSTGQYLYSEVHREFYENGKHVYSLVDYKTPTVVLARKRIDFSRSRQAPEFQLEDMRTGYIEGAAITPTGYKLFTRKDRNSPMEEAYLPIPDPAVVDAGFDYFVRDNFDRLASGQALAVNFAAANRKDFFRFQIASTGLSDVSGRKLLLLKVEPLNVFLKQLVDPIHLSYDLQSRRLVSFQGVSNINDDNGRNYRARIIFEK